MATITINKVGEAPERPQMTPEEAFRATGDPSRAGEPKPPKISITQMPEEMTFLGFDLPAGVEKDWQPIMDLARGANTFFAKAAGLAAEDAALILGDFGIETGILDNPEPVADRLIEFMEQRGIAADKRKATQKWLADIGDVAAQQAIPLAGIFAIAPRLAAASGESVSALLSRAFGQSVQRAPGQTVAGELGAVALTEQGAETGASVGEAIGGVPGRTVGEATGAVAGGLTGALTAQGVGRGAVRTGEALGAGARRLLDGPPTSLAPQEGALAHNVGPGPARDFAREQVEGEMERIDNDIRQTLNTVRTKTQPMRANQALRAGLKKADRVARAQEEGLWRPFRNSPFPYDATELSQTADNIIKRTSPAVLDTLPKESLDRVRRLANLEFPTMKDALAVRSVLLGQLRTDTTLTPDARRVINELQGSLLDTFSKQYPNNRGVQAARKFSKWRADRFERGPIRQVLGPRTQDLQDPATTVDRAIRGDTRVGPDIADVSRKVDRPALIQQGRQFIRSHLRQATGADDLTDEQRAIEGRKLLRSERIQNFQRAFPEVNAEMTQVGDNLGRAIKSRQRIQRSALARFANEDPETAIDRLLTGHNKVEAAREITSKLKANDDAMAGLKFGLLNKMFRDTGARPSRMEHFINGRDIRGVFNEVFTPEEMARLNRMIKEGTSIENQPESFARRASRRGLTIGGGIVGARLGRALNTGTIQTPGILASASRNAVENLFTQTPADNYMALAILDPRFERLLSARAGSIDDLKRINKLARSLIAHTAAGFEVLDTEAERRQEGPAAEPTGIIP